jgi:hypothetical protein
LEYEEKPYDALKAAYKQTYIDILSGDFCEDNTKEFCYHIKYALGEMKEEDDQSIPVNWVREFIDAKFPTYKEYTRYLLEESLFLRQVVKNILIKFLMGNQKVYITLSVT